MKRLKNNIFLTIISFALIALSLVGCTSSKEINQVSDNKKTITIGTSGGYYPFTFSDNGKLSGFEIDVWNDIGKRLGYNVEFKTASFSGLFGMLESGKVDTLANQITISDERKEKYYFTEPTVYSGAQIIVKKGNDSIKSFDVF